MPLVGPVRRSRIAGALSAQASLDTAERTFFDILPLNRGRPRQTIPNYLTINHLTN